MRKVYFIFDYENDLRRANQVRKSCENIEAVALAGFESADVWNAALQQGEDTMMNTIDAALEQAEVSVLLIGEKTSQRPYIDYEVGATLGRGRGLFALRIHSLKGEGGFTAEEGENPLDDLTFENDQTLSSTYPTYEWESDEGAKNLATWVETAVQQAKFAAEESAEGAAG